MKCPDCGLIDHDCRVTDSRSFKNTIKRTRKCGHCGHRWKTYEIIEDKYLYLASRDKTGRKAWTDLETQNLVKFREQGLNAREIGEKLGRTRGSIAAQVKRLLDSGEYDIYLDDIEKMELEPVKRERVLSDEQIAFAKQRGISRRTAYKRIQKGWTVEMAITDPVKRGKRREVI